MTQLSDILVMGNRAIALGLQIEWLAPLAELGTKWTAIAKQLNGLAEGGHIDSIESLLAFLQGRLENENVVAAFNALGLDQLRADLLASSQTYERLPDSFRRFAAPLSHFAETEVSREDSSPQPLSFRDDWIDGADPGEVRLPLSLLAVDGDGKLDKVDFNFAFSADAQISCEAGALWPYRRDAVAPGLLQLSLGGHLEGKAHGKLPFSGGSFSANAGGGGAAELLYFVRPANANSIYAAELLRALPDLPSPFALRSVWNAMATTGLEGIIVSVDGHAEADLAVSLGQGLDLPQVMAGKLGITAKVSFKRKAAYVLSIRAIGSSALGRQRLLVALSRNKSAASDWGVGLGIDLDISPLVNRVHSLLDKALGEWSRELERIRPYLNPGTWIRERLAAEVSSLANDMIADPGLREGLATDLGLLLDTSDGHTSRLQAILVTKLAEKLGCIAGLARGPVEQKAKEATEEIVKALPTLAQEDARNRLDASVAGIVGKFQDALDAEIKAIADTAKANDIGQALASIGVEIDRKMQAADDALEGLRTLVDRFDDLLRVAVDRTADSARQKIGMQLSFEEQREAGLDMEVVGMIDACTPEAEALYTNLMRGKLTSLQALFETGGAVPGFTLDLDRSSIRRFSKFSSKLGFAFVGFGIEVNAFELLSGEADFRLLGNGDIAVTAKGELTKEFDGPREGRTLTFVSAYDLMLLKAGALDNDNVQAQQAISIGIVASHRDKSLQAAEVTNYLSGLANVGLIRADRVKQAGLIYESWSPSGGGNAKHPPGDITVAMTLGTSDVQRLLELGRGVKDELAIKGPFAATSQVFAVGLDAMLRTGRLTEKSLMDELANARHAGFYTSTQKQPDRNVLFGYLQSERRQVGVQVSKRKGRIATGPTNAGPSMANLTNAMLALEGLANMMQLMAEIYDATPADLSGTGGWTEKDYRHHEELLAFSTREWLRLNRKWILWFKQDVSRPTQAFLLSFIALSSGRSASELAGNSLADPHFRITMYAQFGELSARKPITL